MGEVEERIEKLERQNARLRELYESSMAIVRRLQDEREGLIDMAKRVIALGIRESSKKGIESLFSEESMKESAKKAAWHRAMHGEDD